MWDYRKAPTKMTDTALDHSGGNSPGSTVNDRANQTPARMCRTCSVVSLYGDWHMIYISMYFYTGMIIEWNTCQPNAGTTSVRQLTPVALQGKCTSSLCLARSQVPFGLWFWFIYIEPWAPMSSSQFKPGGYVPAPEN